MKTNIVNEKNPQIEILFPFWLISLEFAGTHKALRLSTATHSKARLMTGQKRVTELKHLVKRYLCKTLPQNTAFRLKNQNILQNLLWTLFHSGDPPFHNLPASGMPTKCYFDTTVTTS